MNTDLDIARRLATAGVPIFLAHRSDSFPAGGSDGGGYWLPRRWQYTKPDPKVLDDYEPGMAVCAVMGHVLDAVDTDPRNGGDLPSSLLPPTFGVQQTPSGGKHYFVSPLGVRSKDGVLPGVDVKAGVGGKGVGFVYIAPTEKMSKETGEISTYSWEVEPALDDLELLGDASLHSESGRALTALIESGRASNFSSVSSYEGPDYEDLDTGKQAVADGYLASRLNAWQELLNEAAEWPEGRTDYKGRGWEALTRDFAWNLAMFAASPWVPLDENSARNAYNDLLPEIIRENPKCRGKWYDGLIEKAMASPVDMPPWSDFDPDFATKAALVGLPPTFDDSSIVSWLLEVGLQNRWVWANGLGWLKWTGQKWSPEPDVAIIDDVRKLVIEMKFRALESGADKTQMKEINALQTKRRITDLSILLRGVAKVDAKKFDSSRDLLNVQNGVVDLRTGKLLPHSPEYFMTKIANAEYHPEATHPDWDQTLKSLEPEVADWMQVRFGQAASGYPTSDDILPIGQGGGSNGKTTFISAIRSALGEYAVTVPEKLLRADPSNHPTELMTLYGARLAFIDETPEAAHLDVPRLKAILGSEVITARALYKDNISWRPTHSLFVITNYIPQVRESDHGTWRRLALVRFDKTFKRDDSFRARMARYDLNRSSAVLNWVVGGALAWYANGRVIPPAPAKVLADTQEWREESDQTEGFVKTHFEFDPGSCVRTVDVHEAMNDYLAALGLHPWSAQLVNSRVGQNEMLKSNGVRKLRIRPDSNKYKMSKRGTQLEIPDGVYVSVWAGLKWAGGLD